MTIALPSETFDGPHQAACHGFLHSVESGAAVDGPGMRYVFFMAGCMFRCLYCHNPDTWKLHNGRRVEVGDILSEIDSLAGFLKFAGGVTFSGGEPLMQAPFVGAAARAIKARYGLHIALDTQGFLHGNVTDDWFDPIDLVMLDIKHADPAKYRALTAQPLQPTLECADRLVRLGKQMRIRYVLVPGWTDAPDEVARMADLVASYGPSVEQVEVLPFHQLGTSKWDKLGLEYKLRDTPTPSRDEADAAREVFRSRGLIVS
ncbi:pyruvate formate-lyase-activating protein [Tropicimonas isoalkanivorans]|uniref:Pyruvate formate-lyase-activating enzyme n=1 Tax=Tropicimonas isoalkanivorans TaxID=441112 RepID=A0A1I1PUE2_9RHOB|nr:pyruvate formate-lyase-activating protein [Tropicimonas isoalkanivorans]SFD09540.1 pyruvate formate lyase activating enzyme [Tropicimonas isoalkanivorans]